jgi:AbiV family abortive infection protein
MAPLLAGGYTARERSHVIPRAIGDLSQLRDEDLFGELATGMRLALGNALRLWRDALLLSRRRRPQSFQIIRFLVEEEAAKVHILMDAARCPRKSHEQFERQLRTFSDHLARGLYTEYYEWAIMPIAAAREHIDRERQALYLDGPSDVDWIFRNDIERRREEAMYVAYAAVRDAFHDEHHWHTPNRNLLMGRLPAFTPSILRVARALDRPGTSRPARTARTQHHHPQHARICPTPATSATARVRNHRERMARTTLPA